MAVGVTVSMRKVLEGRRCLREPQAPAFLYLAPEASRLP